MATFVANPLTVTLTAPGEPYYRADLEFHGVDHSKASFEGRLFINNPDAGPDTPTGDESYVGSFWVFGHGGCAGDEGHCEPPAERRAFDFRAEHQLTRVQAGHGHREAAGAGPAGPGLLRADRALRPARAGRAAACQHWSRTCSNWTRWPC